MTAVSLDVQAQPPDRRISLSRVGVGDVEKIIRLRRESTDELYSARIECTIDLGPDQKGAHMSRFEEVINDAIGEVVFAAGSFRAETLAAQIAEEVRDRQGALRAEATITARHPEYKPAPVSAITTQEIYTLFGSAVASAHGTRRLVGVSAQGMTACPCAQVLVEDRTRARLATKGFDDEQIEAIIAEVPIATHNQRGTGTLFIGLTESCDAVIDAMTLLGITETAMSSEIYELMKRSDEAAIVEKAHRNPRFVEDCVREMVSGVIAEFPDLPGDTFVSAHQENLESIHQHNVTAERFGLLRELRREIESGGPAERHVSRREWLDGNIR